MPAIPRRVGRRFALRHSSNLTRNSRIDGCGVRRATVGIQRGAGLLPTTPLTETTLRVDRNRYRQWWTSGTSHPARRGSVDDSDSHVHSLAGIRAAKSLRSGQLEHPHRRRTVDILDFRHQRREPRRLGAPVAHADRDVLLAVHRVRNRSVARHIGQTRFP
jgi:hypothetical protein